MGLDSERYREAPEGERREQLRKGLGEPSAVSPRVLAYPQEVAVQRHR